MIKIAVQFVFSLFFFRFIRIHRHRFILVFPLLFFGALPSALSAENLTEQNPVPSEAFSLRPLSGPLGCEQESLAVTVITEEDLRKCRGCDIPDVLERAGVQVRRFHGRFGQSSDTDAVYVAVRGVSDAQTLLLMDGVRIKDDMLSEPVWPFIPKHHIERIEIVRGPQPVCVKGSLIPVGDSAVGGVIHIFTKKAECAPGRFCTDSLVSLSNESTTGPTAYTSGSVRTPQSGFRIGIQGDRSRDPEKTGASRERALSLNFDHRPQNGKWLMEGSGVFYGNRSNGEPSLSLQDGDSDTVSLGTTYYMSPQLLFKALAGYNREQQDYSGDGEYTSRRVSLKLFGEYHFEFAEGSYVLTAGGERRRERINSDPDDVYDYKKRDTRAAFAGMRGTRGPWNYQVVVRADDLSGDTNEQIWTWNGSVSRHIARIASHDIFVRGGAGTGFRAPGFDEQYLQTVSSSSEENVIRVITIGDPDMAPERSATHEIGVRIEKAGRYFLDITGFKTKLKNPVIFSAREEIPTGEGDEVVYLIRRSQQREADIQGVEVQTGFEWDPCEGKAQYTWTDTDNTERLRGHNPVRRIGSIRWDCLVKPKLSLGTALTHRGDREDNSFPGDTVNLLDIYASYDVTENVSLGFAVRNVTDREYDQYNFTRGPARTLWLTLEVQSF